MPGGVIASAGRATTAGAADAKRPRIARRSSAATGAVSAETLERKRISSALAEIMRDH